ncbi:hypothetical protein PTSG_02385 [Salpingoeca rosetta]|uniref:BOS complex subunit NCLN n=1 Tax=Salpingoeca rosetta (strain ATCC 50818 / BSB-021) TaxID=946362 RepID=F2U219_SALR5|nr:uncharacterized protein PTSG_02385 [Salpingoeca rosetta]EGD81671.1 hypothetical protein PTSG_02385 [Salpingoeca rosetta]|eukprot:XP_004996875.1 hypothetical protein PTSG_02385 [Salpingoeca rosetta]
MMRMGALATTRLPLLLVLSVVLLGCAVGFSAAATTIDVHRLAQVTTAQQILGSTSTSFEGRLTRNAAGYGVLLITWPELARLSSLEQLKCSALVVTLPTAEEDGSEMQHALWHALKLRLLSREWSIPVYFVKPDAPHVQDMLATGLAGKTKAKGKVDFGAFLRGNYHLKVDAPSPTAHDSLDSPALHVHLRGVSEEKPILIVAHYDTYGAVPGVAEADGTGLASALHMLQQLSNLYRDTTTLPKRSVHFLIVGQSSLGYAPLSAWIERYRPADLSFAVCLSSLSTTQHNRLFMHVSKPPRDGSDLGVFVDILNATASERGLPISMVHRKINLAYDLRSWEHEQFSLHRPRTPAMTLSTIPDAPQHGTLFPRAEKTAAIDPAATSAVTSALSEALALVLTDTNNEDEESAVRREGVLASVHTRDDLLTAWIQEMDEQPLLPQDTHAAAEFLTRVQQYLSKRYGVAARYLNFDITTAAVVPHSPINAKMVEQHTAPPGSELVVIGAALYYAAIVYVVMRQLCAATKKKREAHHVQQCVMNECVRVRE